MLSIWIFGGPTTRYQYGNEYLFASILADSVSVLLATVVHLDIT